MIKYSVIMPVYNSSERVVKSINSIIEQTYGNWELIIIDDGSTDDSLKICKEYETKDARIKVLHQKNKGPGIARNLGIANSNGQYIAFLDSDDYYEKDYFEVLNNANDNNDFDLLFFGLAMEYENGEIYKYNSVEKFKKYNKEELLKLQMMGILSWGPCLKIAKSSIVKKCTFSDLPVGEELLFSLNVLKKSDKIGFVDNTLYHYVYNHNGQHTKGGEDPWGQLPFTLKEYLFNQNEYTKFEKSVNSLALRALSISIYRCSNKLKYKNAKFKIKLAINKYKDEYDIKNIESQLIDKSSKLILIMINLKLYYLLYLASQFKNRRKLKSI